MTSLSEAGEGEDAGRWRLTFCHQGRALRLIVDARGEVLGRTTFPIGSRNASSGPGTALRAANAAPAGRKEA
ncbi:DUF6522 family protein [Celeribacter baekdonensis]|uniref:DUF6522 family protein n=1 Tax=Celeribacter baekdonensis TaxID=875171 RepID=UPI0022B76BBE|nr:DUF6522 family protein [Celeribacter baekdonensis]